MLADDRARVDPSSADATGQVGDFGNVAWCYTISKLVPTGAAARSGQVAVGDRVVCIEGRRVDTLSIEEAKMLIKGANPT